MRKSNKGRYWHPDISKAEKKRAARRNRMDLRRPGARYTDTLVGHDGKEYAPCSGNYIPPANINVGIIFWVGLILLLLMLASNG